jgi:hypothetical protein
MLFSTQNSSYEPGPFPWLAPITIYPYAQKGKLRDVMRTPLNSVQPGIRQEMEKLQLDGVGMGHRSCEVAARSESGAVIPVVGCGCWNDIQPSGKVQLSGQQKPAVKGLPAIRVLGIRACFIRSTMPQSRVRDCRAGILGSEMKVLLDGRRGTDFKMDFPAQGSQVISRCFITVYINKPLATTLV